MEPLNSGRPSEAARDDRNSRSWLGRIGQFLGRMTTSVASRKVRRLFKQGDPDWILGEGSFARAVMVSRGNRYYVLKENILTDGKPLDDEFKAAKAELTKLRRQKSDLEGWCQKLLLKVELIRKRKQYDSQFSRQLIKLEYKLVRLPNKVPMKASSYRKLLASIREFEKEAPYPEIKTLVLSLEMELRQHAAALVSSEKDLEAARKNITSYEKRLEHLLSIEDERLEKISGLNSRFLLGGEPSDEGMVTPFAGGTLGQMLGEGTDKNLPPELAKEIFFQTVAGMHDLHNGHYNHMDLSFDNVLIDAVGQVKITDFGLSCKNDELFSKSGRSLTKPECELFKASPSIYFQPPERYSGTGERPGATDVWASGVHLAALLAGKKPEFTHLESLLRKAVDGTEVSKILQEQVGNYCIKLIAERYGDNSSATDLARRIFESNPGKRITAKQMLEHPFFEEELEPLGQVQTPPFFVEELKPDEQLLRYPFFEEGPRPTYETVSKQAQQSGSQAERSSKADYFEDSEGDDLLASESKKRYFLGLVNRNKGR